MSTGAVPIHAPVLAREVVAALVPRRDGLYIDATLGLGGHSELLLERGARVIGLDRDSEAIAFASARLDAYLRTQQFQARHADYRSLLRLLANDHIMQVDGIVADLGVSSYQLDSGERGFSFRSDAPLDMRMDRSRGTTAADLLATCSESELTQILFDYGEEPDARRIARGVIAERERSPLRTTTGLAQLVASLKRRPRPGRASRRAIHPATLTFQALRIAVNDEVRGIDQFVIDAVSVLNPTGRIAVISFHSLEDRQVKTALRELARGCTCPTRIVVCVCGQSPAVTLVRRGAIKADADEIARNPRSRSARLRVAEKYVATGNGS